MDDPSPELMMVVVNRVLGTGLAGLADSLKLHVCTRI